MSASEAQRLKQLEEECSCLKRVIADLTRAQQILQGRARKEKN